MDKSSDILIQLGLTSQEASTYYGLIDLEAVSIRKVAEKTGINRGTTYEIIKKLVSLGLVSVRKSGKREYYSAESPDKIFDLIQERRRELWHVLQEAKSVVPSLSVKQARPQGRPLVKYYQDDEGVVTILRDVLQTCGKLPEPHYYAYSSKTLRQYLYRKFPKFTERRINEGINVKVIAVGEGGEPVANSERKWLPEPKDGAISSYTIIYDNKVAIISISSDFTPYGVIIEDSGNASMQRLLFEQIWSTL